MIRNIKPPQSGKSKSRRLNELMINAIYKIAIEDEEGLSCLQIMPHRTEFKLISST